MKFWGFWIIFTFITLNSFVRVTCSFLHLFHLCVSRLFLHLFSISSAFGGFFSLTYCAWCSLSQASRLNSSFFGFCLISLSSGLCKSGRCDTYACILWEEVTFFLSSFFSLMGRSVFRWKSCLLMVGFIFLSCLLFGWEVNCIGCWRVGVGWCQVCCIQVVAFMRVVH